jgi:hypothetical protein
MFRIFRRTVAVLLLAGAALVAVPAAAADTLVTLTGEEVTANPGTSTVNVQCGSPSTVSYHAEGTAVGPYPGTFVEDGSVTFGADGVILSFSATFSIDSPAGDVMGEKVLDPSGQSNFGSCEPAPGFPEFAQASFAEMYEATITDGLGRTFTETGRATTLLEASEPAAGPGTLNVMAQSFQSGGPPGTTIELTPVTSVNPTGTSHTVTAIVRDAAMEPVQGMTVLFVVTSPTGFTSRCVTDSEGICPLTYQGPSDPQADDIRACADTNVNGNQDPTEPCADASKVWTRTPNSPGQVTGGGYIREFRVNFALHAKAQTITDPAEGGCNVNDHLEDVRIQCLSVTSVVITPTHATIMGQAEQDGIATNYTIDVDDLSDQGLPDTFEIRTDLGYLNGGTLTGGNIHINL